MVERKFHMSQPFIEFDYQIPMIRWMLEREVSALFCSPSMGKTAVSLKVISEWILDGAVRAVLLIAPVRVCSVTWPTQKDRWDHSSWMTIAHLRTPEGREAWEKGSADIYLINPEQLPKLVPLLFKGRKTLPVDGILIDELSLAKNPTSKRFNSIRPYLHKFRRRTALTGSPVPNNYLDLYAQIRLLDEGARLGKSFSHYRQTYFKSDYMGFKWELLPGAKEKIDAKLADLCLVMLGDDYLEVPDCATEDLPIVLPPEAKADYKRLEKELLLELEQSDVVALTAATLCGKLLQITSGAVYGEERVVNRIHSEKISALRKLRKKHSKEPLLVLTGFKHESARILEEFPEAKMFHEKLIPDWQAGKIKMMVSDPRSLSHGIDGLQVGGHIAVWMTLTYSNETYLQTNARLVRTGQSHKTTIYRLIAGGTIDDAVAAALRDKSDTQSGLMNALKALQLLTK